MITKYNDGSDITIMNCYYQYGKLDRDTGKRKKDFIVIVYKDNRTGKKYHEIIYKPKYTFYKVTDNSVDLSHSHLFLPKESLEEVTCEYSKLLQVIAEVSGNEIIEGTDNYKFDNNLEWFWENIKDKNPEENKKLHKLPSILRSDLAIEDYYRLEFGKKYTNEITKISKAFFDIEVDTRWMAGSFVEPGECPINAIAFHDETHDVIIDFILRDSRNPQIKQLEYEYNSGIFAQNAISNFVENAIGGWKQMSRYHLNETKFKLLFFDDELELIATFFYMVHKYKPDFIEGWNSSGFDLEYIRCRIIALGADPEIIMCDQSWEEKIVKHYIDRTHLSKFAERGDYTFISGETVWIDQLIQFTSRRKAKIGSFTSFKLDDIGKKVAKVRKLDYHHITTDIGMLPWLDFKTFILYNIFDVIVQKCIEIKTQDLEYLFTKCIVNNTSYKKAHRQTVYLINRMTKEFDNRFGFIIGNNVNKWNKEPEEKFIGALVGDPENTSGYSKMKINNIPIMVSENLQDSDYKALYPSIIAENNIAPNTQLGKIEIPNKVYENENFYNNEKYSRGGEFIENMVTDNIVEFCKRWFGLAGIIDMIQDIDEYREKYIPCYSSYNKYDSYYLSDDKELITIPLVYTPKPISPFIFNKNPINPFINLTPRR